MIWCLTSALADIDLKTVVVAFGAIWALYKALHRGTLRRVLDLGVSGKLIEDGNGRYLLCSIRAKNVQLRVVRVEYCALQVSLMREVGGYLELFPAGKLKPIGVLQDYKKIRGDETIRDKILLTVPPNEDVFDVYFKAVAKLNWYQLPFSLLSKIPGLRRFAPKRSRWYARDIIHNYERHAGVRNEGNHPGRRGGVGRGNEAVEGRDREEEEQE